MTWTPWLGAVPDARGTTFRVWAPRTDALEVEILGGPRARLTRQAEGYFVAHLEGVRAGARYHYRFPDGRLRPDPASLLQPQGVHGPSEVVDLAAHASRVPSPPLSLEQLAICEIHLGTFTPLRTAAGAAERMPLLAQAGYTGVEVMPVAAFPGARNWGYDGVALFAAHADYGGPAGLATLVDAAHRAGLRILLDVVYNHLGPEGNYLSEFGPYFTQRHKTPWGDALNFDGPDAGPVRRFFIENALRWTSAAGAGFDGLRLDAVHGIVDESPVHILRELNDAVQREASQTGRTVWLIAESDLNDKKLVEEPPAGYGLASAWSDDVHHALHVALTGERAGYYEDFAPPAVEPLEALASALREGWHYRGQHSPFRGAPHGTPAAHLPGRRTVACAQNHDQIGNRARGERLTALTDVGGLRVAAALVALSPALPLYFQGEEWSAPEPFQYFVSHGDPQLVEAVRRGRREEFRRFAEFGQVEVPDPQAESTFAHSTLDWSRRETAAGQAALRWHRELLALRRQHPALSDDARANVQAQAQGQTLLLRRRAQGRELWLALSFGQGPCVLTLPAGTTGLRVLLDSGDPAFGVPEGLPAQQLGEELRLHGRQAVVLERARIG